MAGRIFMRYSEAFKLKVVEEIERGERSISDAKKVYDIGGAATIQKWVEGLGRNYLLNKVVRVQMKDERDKIKALEARNRLLEKALANKEIEAIAWKSMVEVAEEHYGIDIKKNFLHNVPEEQRKSLEDVLGKSVKFTVIQGRDITNVSKLSKDEKRHEK